MWITGCRRSGLFPLNIPITAYFTFICIAGTIDVGELPGGLNPWKLSITTIWNEKYQLHVNLRQPARIGHGVVRI